MHTQADNVGENIARLTPPYDSTIDLTVSVRNLNLFTLGYTMTYNQYETVIAADYNVKNGIIDISARLDPAYSILSFSASTFLLFNRDVFFRVSVFCEVRYWAAYFTEIFNIFFLQCIDMLLRVF